MSGVTVPDFNCDDPTATEVPNQGTVYQAPACAAPDQLNQECDPQSRFHVLHRNVNNDGIYIVAHCRKKGQGSGLYGDIAVIQYNKNTGSTCFYQVGPSPNLPAAVQAPSKGTTAYPWNAPSTTAGQQCVSCHDSGPFIRSPYLAQLGEVWPSSRVTHDANYLPGTLGAETSTWNNGTMPYRFVGLDFQSWEAYSVADSAHPACTSCHRMGLGRIGANYSGGGTSLDFGIRATATAQVHKFPHGTMSGSTSPIWMTPGLTTYDASNDSEAHAMASCASSIAAGTPSSTCHAFRYAAGDTCGNPTNVPFNGPTSSTDPTSWKNGDEIDLGCKDTAGCQPGFYYFTTLHGPFYQNSPSNIPTNSPSFRGSYARIYGDTTSGHWKLAWGLDATDLQGGTGWPPGGPGGTAAGIPFSRISSVPLPDTCTGLLGTIVDPDGTHAMQSTVLGSPAGVNFGMTTGLIGNVSRSSMPRDAPTDYLRVADGVNTLFTQAHSTSIPANGWFTAEAYSWGCSSWSAGVHYAAHVYSTNDSLLVSAAQAPNVICYIDGLRGDWSRTRSNGSGGSVQPYAQIYTAATGEVRLKVSPVQADPNGDGVSAYATCLTVN